MNWKYTILNLSFIGKINSINKLRTIFLKRCCLFRDMPVRLKIPFYITLGSCFSS